MPMEQFGQHLLPSLLSLSSDPVANVRVLVAKALRQSVMEKGQVQINGIIHLFRIRSQQFSSDQKGQYVTVFQYFSIFPSTDS